MDQSQSLPVEQKKKQTRRAKGKPMVNDLTVYSLNIRGFFSKMDSLSDIIENTKIDVIVLNELKTKNTGRIRKFFKERGYDVFVKPEGGILLATKVQFQMENVTSSTSKTVISGLVQDLNLRIIAAYGPQESVPKDERQEFFDELQMEILSSVNSANDVIIAGDLNAKIEQKDKKIVSKGNGESNGDMLLEIINEHSLDVQNFNPICTGYYTRVQEEKGVISKSLIDYCISNSYLTTKMKNIMVDEDRILAPFHVKNGKIKEDGRQYSDHNPVIVTFGISYREVRKKKLPLKDESSGWKITDTGMKQFSELTAGGNTPSLRNVNTYTDLQSELERLMDSCFQRKKKKKKSSTKQGRIENKELKSMLHKILPLLKRGKAEKKVAQEYIAQLRKIQQESVQESRAKRICETLTELKDEQGNFSVEQFWKLRKSINGSNVEEKTSIITPEGVELFDAKAIMNEYKKEFEKRLSHRKIHPELEEYEKLSERLIKLRMTLECMTRDEPDFTIQEVALVLKIPKKGTACGPDLLVPDVFAEAGEDLVWAITKIFNDIKNQVITPSEWVQMLIKTLYKNKGSRKVLTYHRGIFLTCVLAKMLERLLLTRIKPQSDSINPLQCGSGTNRSIRDMLFLLYGLIDHALYLNKTLYLTSYDYATCFDSLWLEDSILSLWDLGVQNKILPLIYKLNETAVVKVKTPFGTTDSFTAPTIVKQGTVFGSKLCCASTAEICDEDCTGGASVGSVSVASTVYVDDANRINNDINDTVTGHDKFIFFSMKKRLPIHPTKCVILIVNKKAHDSCPMLKIDEHIMEEVKETKIVGDMVNNKGNRNSLVEDRVKSGKSVIANMLATCSEVTCGMYYVKVMLLLYRSVFIQTMLSNSDVWTNISDKNMTALETIQLKCLKRTMRTAASTPNSFVFLELGVLPMKFEIYCRQLNYLHHILNLEQNNPIFQVYQQQLKYPFEANWATKIEQLKALFDLPNNAKIVSLSKGEWKGLVKRAVRKKAHKILLEEAKTKKKLNDITFPTDYTPQPYLKRFSSKVVQTIFKTRGRSTNVLANRGSHEACRLCKKEEETQEHVLNCELIRGEDRTISLTAVKGMDENNYEDVLEIAKRFIKFQEIISS